MQKQETDKNLIKIFIFFVPSIFLLLIQFGRGAGAHPSSHRARNGLHHGQITSLSYGYDRGITFTPTGNLEFPNNPTNTRLD